MDKSSNFEMHSVNRQKERNTKLPKGKNNIIIISEVLQAEVQSENVPYKQMQLNVIPIGVFKRIKLKISRGWSKCNKCRSEIKNVMSEDQRKQT